MKTPPPSNVVALDIPEKTKRIRNINADSITYEKLLDICVESKINQPDASQIFAIKEKIVAIFNETHSAVRHGSKTLICEAAADHKGKLAFSFANFANMRTFYQNLSVTYTSGTQDKPKYKELNCFDVWAKALERNSYQGVVFDPSNKAPAWFLNMWDGFQVDPIAAIDKLDKILWHFEHVLCDGNYDNYQYLLAWLSDIFQNPHRKNGVCLVLKSEGRGTGKTTLEKIIEPMLGHHFTVVNDSKHFLGQFNKNLANKLVVAISEAFWSGSNKDAGKFRSMITDSTMTIEAKGIDAIEIDSYHRFMMCSNNHWVVPAHVDERRFFVLLVSEMFKGNKEYFDALYDDINDPEAIGQLLHFFLTFDLSPFNLRKAPMTEEGKRQILHSLKPHETWLQYILDEGFIVDDYGMSFELKEDTPIPKSAFYDSYIKYCNKMSVKDYSRQTSNMVGDYLIKIIKPLKTDKKATIKGRSIRPNCYLLRPLEEMKSLFNSHYCQE